MKDFNVQVADATAGATIYYEWAFDYPPYDPNLTRALGGVQTLTALPDGQSVLIPPFTLGCLSVTPAPGSGPNYLFALILADKPFSHFQFGQFDDPAVGGMAPTYIWPVDMPCSATTGIP